MSLSAPVQLARDLDWLDIQHHRRGSLQGRGDLLVRARQLEKDASSLGIPDMIAVSHLRTGELLRAEGEIHLALEQADLARGALGELRQEDLQVQAIALRIECLADLGRWAEVNEAAEQGIGLVEQYRYEVSGPYLKAAYLRARIGLFSRGVQAALIIGDLTLALCRAELCKCRGISVSGSRPDNVPESVQVAELQTQIRKLNQTIDEALERGERPQSLRARRRILWDLLSVADSGLSASAGGIPQFDRDEIVARIHPGQAVLYYFWIDKSHLLRLVFDHRESWFDVRPLGESVRKRLLAYSDAIFDMQAGAAQSLVDRVQDFSDVLWPDDSPARRILQRARRLIISPHRMLHALPYSALQVDGEYLARRYALRMLPNLTSLLASGPPAQIRSSVLAVGVSQYSIPDLKLGVLPMAEDEARDVTSLYCSNAGRGEVLVGTDASEPRLELAAKGEYEVLHLACHGLNVDSDTPLESRLFLSATSLEAIRIPLLGLRPSLAVLSACCSGQRAFRGRDMDELPGDDLFGLSAMLFSCGVREILAPLYPVQDRVARSISLQFHKSLLQGHAADVALQIALCEYMENAGCLSRTPVYWAAFQLTALGPGIEARAEVGPEEY